MKKRLIVASLAVACLLSVYIVVQLYLPLPIRGHTAEVYIPRGATFRQITQIFSESHVIRNRLLFSLLGRLSGLDRKVRAGYYRISDSMNLLDLLMVLKRGDIIEFEITVVEGDSLDVIAEKLSAVGIMEQSDFWQIAYDKEFLGSHHINAPSCEGYLFPDTYRIPKGTDTRDALSIMIKRLRQQYSEELSARAAEIGMTENEVLTLASIIEKEAATDMERPLISAVYHNRLRKDMMLQADPTAIYGVKRAGEIITAEDLKRKTPYNTYRIKGLPPGPIASPGIRSIRAALYPADVRYLFFVSNNDGTHQFSITAAEHNAAVRSYREKKRAVETREKMNSTLRGDHGAARTSS